MSGQWNLHVRLLNLLAVAALGVSACAQTPTAAPTEPATATALPPTATPAAAATATATATADPLASVLDTTLRQLNSASEFDGSVLVARNGHVILSKGYGLADQSQILPNTPQTKFRLYQVTMQFTAMAILLLQERGKLSVRDNICKYLTDCPSAWQPVTIQHLLTHTSGIFDTWDIHSHGSLTSTLRLTGMISASMGSPLAFQPGTQAHFDNMGYILLGKIIESASGETYPAFLQENIFGPLGMTHTDYDDNRTDVALGDQGGGSDPVNAWVPFSAAGLDSTVGDLYLWDQALYTDKLAPQKTVDALFTPYVRDTDDPGSLSYGYGWLIGTDNNRRVFFDESAIVGFTAIIMRYPDDKATVILLSNDELDPQFAYNTAEMLAQKVLAQ